MGFFQALTDLFDSIFKRSSPEFQKKQVLKKLDAEIKEFFPSLCKNGMLNGNFAEAIHALYLNTRPLDNLFAVTVSPNDIPRQHRFEAQLIVTGYSAADMESLEELSFENRKAAVLAERHNPERIYIHQKKILEHLLKQMNTEDFKKMDQEILNLRSFVEFCHYNFTPFMQTFDQNFIPSDFTYSPNYVEVPIEKLQNLLEDIYYQSNSMTITTSLADAVIAIASLRKGGEISEGEKKNYIGNIKKINYVLTRVLSPDKLKLLIRYAAQNADYEPRVGSLNGSPRQEFANMLQSRFSNDEQKIKTEIQNETISGELRTLFGNEPMDEVGSYNQVYNDELQADTAFSFKWVFPMQILKTFLRIYIPDSIKSLLNDIVIEGFFNNPSYKSNFSTIVYSVINADKEVGDFEATFGTNQKNSISVMESYIKDSKKDPDFYKKLEKMVMSINNDAHAVLQSVVTALHSLSKNLGELLEDAKKPSSEIISNLKVLFFSSRNRENTNLLDGQYQNWNIFFEIMKNYVIINTSENQ